jgi:putative PIN family toxin of toxin-antitoxin system
MRVILDTNVVVSAVRSKRGASAELLKLLAAGTFTIAISAPLVFEYEEILVRELIPQFISIDDTDQLIRFICEVGEKYHPHQKLRPMLSDADDDFILELASSAGVEYIVTHNARHFKGAAELAIAVLQPARFLKLLKGES